MNRDKNRLKMKRPINKSEHQERSGRSELSSVSMRCTNTLHYCIISSGDLKESVVNDSGVRRCCEAAA